MKQINRRFANILRSFGFRGPAADQTFDLVPTIQPVAMFAEEPETLPRFFVGYSGVGIAGGNPVGIQLTCLAPTRLRAVHGAVSEVGNFAVVTISGTSRFAGGLPAAQAISSSDGTVPLNLAYSGQLTAASGFGLAISSNYAGTGPSNLFENPFVIPAGRFVQVMPRNAVAFTTFTCGLAWEELADR